MDPTPTSPDRRHEYQQHPVDGPAFKELARAGLDWLRANRDVVNALNVFPVPDGDTGTNMMLTMQSAIAEVAETDAPEVGVVVQEIAQGALMGARGNSGVILSQIWRGFARALDGHAILTVPLFSEALAEARDTAYRGVVRPVEGTILTVSKDMAEAAQGMAGATNDFVTLLEVVVQAADGSVAHTPELLPILKEACVVDSGGKGLFYIFDGMLRFINGQSLDEAERVVQPLSSMDLEGVLQEVQEGQDYEVIVDFKPGAPLDLQKFYGDLEDMGTSIQVGEGDGIMRVHIHVPVENRYLPIDYTMEIGTITKVHIENLMEQMDEIEAAAAGTIELTEVQSEQIAAVVVSPGDGISRVFASLGAHAIVGGGQTMNPSTAEIVAAFEDLPAEKIIILPNNKNIILAAEAAKEVSVKQVEVIPCRTIPQGLCAMLSFDPDAEFGPVVGAMNSALDEVVTGEITTATRSVEIDGVKVEEGQIIALHNGKLVLSAGDLLNGCMAFLEKTGVEDYELITMFYGSETTLEEAQRIADHIQEAYPDHEIEIQDGGQAHYQFIFSIE